MKVAHFAAYTPHAAGQYGTVRDLVLAEQAKGIDAGFVNCGLGKGGKAVSKAISTNNGMQVHDDRWALDADIIVRHTCLTGRIEHSGKPIVMCLHGRPESSWMIEFLDVMQCFRLVITKAKEHNYVAGVTFWDEFLPIWKMYMPDFDLHYVPATVDTDFNNPEGKKHDFGKWSGSPNIVVADKFRHDISPFNVMMAAARFKDEMCPTAKLHCYGIPVDKGKGEFLAKGLKNNGCLGQAHSTVANLDEIFRSADMLITPHVIATRVIREALASGLPVVAGTGCKYTEFTADSRDVEGFAKEIKRCWDIINGNEKYRQEAREVAKREFNCGQAADGMIKVFEKVLSKETARSPEQKNVVHIVNAFVKKHKYERYLEIGVYRRKVYSNVACKDKTSVDPLCDSDYHMMSDEFFANLKESIKYDLIFIDGNHMEDFADRDIKNSLDHLAEGGTILVHDCNPKTEFMQREYVEGMPPPWSGQVWRSFVNIKLRRNDLEMYVIDFDTGIGVIRRGQTDPIEDMIIFSDISYDFFDKHRKRLLSLLTVEEWVDKMKEVTDAQ